MCITEEKLVEAYGNSNPHERFLLIYKNYSVFPQLVDCYETGLFNPSLTIERDDGWRGFRIQGTLDFSLIGILSKLSGILAEHKIGIFAISTYNTDYILVKRREF